MSINRVNIGESLPMRTVCYASVIVSFDPVVKSPVHANGCKEHAGRKDIQYVLQKMV